MFACLFALWALPSAVRAQHHGEVADLQLERTAEGLLRSAAVQLELLYKALSLAPEAVLAALQDPAEVAA